MSFDERGIYQEPRTLVFTKHSIKNVFPDTFISPTAKSAVDIVPITVT
jgi:hypothetical protein